MFPDASSRQAPKVTVAADGTLITTYIVQSGRDAKVMMSTSADHGLVWSAPLQISTVLYGTIGLQRQPITVKAPNGTLHAIWENVRTGNTLSIYHTRSTDGGVTWTTPTPVYLVNDGRSQDFSSIAVAPNGTIYVSFLSADLNALDGLQHVLVVRSMDDGVSWTKPVRADMFTEGGACECCQQNIAVSREGLVAIAFRSNINNRRDVFLALSADSGASFITPVPIQTGTWTIDACPATGPSLMFDTTGMLHTSWRDTRDAVGRNVVYYARYLPFSRMMVQNIDLSTGHADEAEYPFVAASPSGEEVAVIFESSRGVQIARSRDGGQTFQHQVVDPLTTHTAYPHIVWTQDGHPFAAWRSIRSGISDIQVVREGATSVREWGIGNGEWGIRRTFDLMGRECDPTPGRPAFVVTSYPDGTLTRKVILPGNPIR